MEKFISRKFVIAFLSIVTTSSLVFFGKITDGVYSTIMVCTIGAYLTANVMQKKDEK